MDRQTLQRMSIERPLDAEALLQGRRWDYAYYVSGYAVECALKSCVLSRMIHTAWVFQEKWNAEKCRTHDLGKLVELAGLNGELNQRLKAGGGFEVSWAFTSAWKVDSRYQSHTENQARELLEAITHPTKGVLPWLQIYW